MKKILAIALALAMMFVFASCGSQEEQNTESDNDATEVSLIIVGDINDGGFNQITWECIDSFCSEKEVSCGYYVCEGSKIDQVTATVDEAIGKDGKLLIFAGSKFEKAVYELQSKYEDKYFYLIDGVPNDGKDYKLADNSIGVLFAEEEAGYLAGYAAVMDGYRNLGFMGGEKMPPVKRYGYGFIQGASAAAAESGINDEININYMYSGTFEASDKVQAEAEKWYEDGTEIIFSCGGGIIKSVISASDAKHGKIIGVDTDQSGMSGDIITSARKGIDSAVEDVLKEYNRGNFIGNNIFKYTASNGGVGLEMANARFKRFSEAQYNDIFEQIKSGSVSIKKDTDVESVKDLAEGNIKVHVKK